MRLQVNFHTTLSGDAMVTLLYHKKLDASWRDAAQKLRSGLAQLMPILPASCSTTEPGEWGCHTW